MGASTSSEEPADSSSRELWIALGAVLAIGVSLGMRAFGLSGHADWPLLAALVFGGGPLVLGLARSLMRGVFGSDLLAGISICTSLLLGEHLAGAMVVLMLAGGAALERYAVARASSALRALARRTPTVAHRRRGGQLADTPLDAIAVGDEMAIFPHEICPVDGVVLEGMGHMDESYLTGEPYEIAKAPGASVLSGAVNGPSGIVIRATRIAAESRFARIVEVMRATERKRPRLRRIGDRLGAIYTPIALAIALGAWIVTGDATRFLSVLVIATPCPLLIAIPVAIIGGISLAARRGIVVRDPAVMERMESCRTIIFDKTGTLTYGAPRLTSREHAPGVDGTRLLGLAASLERYSKHPLASAILQSARDEGAPLADVAHVSEEPGRGLTGRVGGRELVVTGRRALAALDPAAAAALPEARTGLECALLLDGRFAGLYRFHDAPRAESRLFVRHLGRKHMFDRVLLVSGDRAAEVAHLAQEVGIDEVYAGKSPEEKVEIVAAETRRAQTIFVGDGVNDAPALLAATVGLAFGRKSDVTAEAAGAVIMDASLARVDEFFHLSRRMRAIALQSAIGGMALSILGMFAAAAGLLTPVAGAVGQELIDLAAIANALRAAMPPSTLTDFDS